MNRSLRSVRRLVPVVGLLLAGCLSGNPPVEIRWFEPRIDATTPPIDGGEGAGDVVTLDDVTNAGSLRVDDVRAAPHLDQRMAWRVSEVEFAFDEANRWVMPPADATRRALATALFAHGRFTPAPNADAPMLDVYVLSFEGVTYDSPRVEVRLVAVHRATFAGPTHYASFHASEQLEESTPEALAITAGRVLARIATDVAAWVPGP